MQMIRKDTFPCKDCTDRAVGCHGSCEKYTGAKQAYNKQMEEYKQAEKLQDDVDDFKITSVIRTKERSRRKR